MSSLLFISRLIERLAGAQITEQMDNNSVSTSHRSAITKHHSTSPVLRAVRDPLVQAISHKTITGICFPDLFQLSVKSIILFGWKGSDIALVSVMLQLCVLHLIFVSLPFQSRLMAAYRAFPRCLWCHPGSLLGLQLIFLLSPVPVIPYTSGRPQTWRY